MIKRIKDIVKNRKKKKGFTLVELLAVIVILAIIMILTIPAVIGGISNSKEKSFETVGKSIKKYLQENYDNCKLGNKHIANYDDEIFDDKCKLKYSGDELSDLLVRKTGYSKNDVKKVVVGNEEEGKFEVKVKAESTGNFSGVKDYATAAIIYKQHDLKGSTPNLDTGLIPVVYNKDKSKWVVADISEEWYNYSSTKQWWANAVSVEKNSIGNYKEDGEFISGKEILDSDLLAMFVWIPRFSYTIRCHEENKCYGFQVEGASSLSQATPGAIDIKFISIEESENGDATYNFSNGETAEDSYLTHPAFNFDGNISGMWVGKFETTEVADKPTILPNKKSLVGQKIYDQYITAQKFTASDNIYGLTGNAHMMKNSEWGAVAYLSQSIYGKYGNSSYSVENKEIFKNDSSNFTTGRSYGNVSNVTGQYSPEGSYGYHEDYYGTGASTTGNIYGIYDMSGGAYEIVMAWYKRASDEFGQYSITNPDGTISTVNGSGFGNSNKPDNKYYDIYDSNMINEKSSEVKGHATAETSGWYLDEIQPLSAWAVRGGFVDSDTGKEIGIFSSTTQQGIAIPWFGFRTVLV